MIALAALLVAMAAPAAALTKVRVDVYAEGLCPYCIEFTQTKLAELFKTGLSKIAEIDFIASGNARAGDDGEITCQHGPNECNLNRAISCAIANAPSQDNWFTFVECLEGKAKKDRDVDAPSAAGQCAAKAGILASRVLDCYHGAQGDTLLRLALERTESLVPKQRWVPWVVVNGIPLFDDFDNVATFVCAAYTGTPKPAFCLHPPPPDPSKPLRAPVSRRADPAVAAQ